MSVTTVVVITIIIFLCVPFFTGSPTVISRDFLNVVLVHKSARAMPPFCSSFCPLEPHGTLNAMLSSRKRVELGQQGESIHTDWCTASHFLRASLSILITQELIWLQSKKEMSSYLNTSRHSPYDAKCHSGSVQKTGAAKVPEAACTQ